MATRWLLGLKVCVSETWSVSLAVWLLYSLNFRQALFIKIKMKCHYDIQNLYLIMVTEHIVFYFPFPISLMALAFLVSVSLWKQHLYNIIVIFINQIYSYRKKLGSKEIKAITDFDSFIYIHTLNGPCTSNIELTMYYFCYSARYYDSFFPGHSYVYLCTYRCFLKGERFMRWKTEQIMEYLHFNK